MEKAVFGLADNEKIAQQIVDNLLSSGFSNSSISVLYPNRNSNNGRVAGNTQYDNTVDNTDYTNTTYNNAGFSNGQYGHKDKNGKKESHLGTEKHTKAPEGAATGAAAGGILGGSLGLLAGIGALAIPGLGPFIAAGPILAALSGSGIGGGLGLLIGALVGSGIPEYEAKRYEVELKEGKILLSVHTNSDEEIKRATDILKREGAKDISTSREKTQTGY